MQQHVHQNSPYSALVQPIFGTPPTKPKLASNNHHSASNPWPKSFAGTPSRLISRGQGRSRYRNSHSHCGSPSRATALKMTPNDSSGSGLTFDSMTDLRTANLRSLIFVSALAPYETVQKRSIQRLKHTKTQPTTIAAYKIAWLGSRQSVQRRSIQNRITQKDVNKMGYQIESVSYKIVSYKVTLSKTH